MTQFIFALVNDAPAPALYQYASERGGWYIFSERQKELVLRQNPGAVMEPVAPPPEDLVNYLIYARPRSAKDIAAAIERWEQGRGADPVEVLGAMLDN